MKLKLGIHSWKILTKFLGKEDGWKALVSRSIQPMLSKSFALRACFAKSGLYFGGCDSRVLRLSLKNDIKYHFSSDTFLLSRVSELTANLSDGELRSKFPNECYTPNFDLLTIPCGLPYSVHLMVILMRCLCLTGEFFFMIMNLL